MSGVLALVGGGEFERGNETQDRILVEAAAGRPAYVVCAAVRLHPERAAEAARRWFATLGADVSELVVHSRPDAAVPSTVEAARGAGLVYVAGGDPGRTVQLLAGTAVWDAIVAAWQGGAALAGSSAGAMALGEWSLVRDRWPQHDTRRAVDALAIVPGSAVLPHFDTFGQRWIPSAQTALGAATPLIGIDERTAALWHVGAWTTFGRGAVTLIIDSQRQRVAAGAPIAGMPQPRDR
ncbi:MAG: Type 1 glutamine amidotransferase-like domain-containing protein [Candidatus Dormibacter sp.]